jgi:hypothetical protein
MISAILASGSGPLMLVMKVKRVMAISEREEKLEEALQRLVSWTYPPDAYGYPEWLSASHWRLPGGSAGAPRAYGGSGGGASVFVGNIDGAGGHGAMGPAPTE